jgi:integrase
MRWFFPARGSDENAFSGFSKAKKKLDEATGVSGWRLHDLRRTVSTGMAHLKIRVEVVEKLLNHSTGTLGGVAGVYNRFAYMDEMRDAVERWAEFIDELISGAAASSA